MYATKCLVCLQPNALIYTLYKIARSYTASTADLPFKWIYLWPYQPMVYNRRTVNQFPVYSSSAISIFFENSRRNLQLNVHLKHRGDTSGKFATGVVDTGGAP